MRLLILGGTSFLGRHLAEQAVARGYDVTLFNRGQTNPGLYEGVTEIHGDRTKDLAMLEGLEFDSVIDPSGYFPRDVEATAKFLKPIAPHYAFISSGSVYADPDVDELTEDSPAFAYDEALEAETEIKPETYGPLKAECERRACQVYGDGALILRPGLIVGRYDATGRFSYWPQRMRRGGAIAAPDTLSAPVQFLDAHDLARWTLDLCERKVGGILNAVGPAKPMIFSDLLTTFLGLAPEGSTVVPLPEAFLKEQGVSPWTGLPLWIPADAGARGFMAVSTTKMLAHGMKIRPLSETVADILAEIDENGTFLAGASLTEEAEQKLLAAWDASP